MSRIEKVTQIIKDVLNEQTLAIGINDGQDSVDGWDSLATVNILMAVSREYDISFAIDDFQNFTSVKKILDVLEKQ